MLQFYCQPHGLLWPLQAGQQPAWSPTTYIALSSALQPSVAASTHKQFLNWWKIWKQHSAHASTYSAFEFLLSADKGISFTLPADTAHMGFCSLSSSPADCMYFCLGRWKCKIDQLQVFHCHRNSLVFISCSFQIASLICQVDVLVHKFPLMKLITFGAWWRGKRIFEAH